jgi:hypothetical protein
MAIGPARRWAGQTRLGRTREAGSRRWIVACVTLAVIAAGVPATAVPAFADSAVIGVTNTAGDSDPAADLPRVFTVSGATEAPERIFVKTRAVGGAPCAPSAGSDTGDRFLVWEADVNGAYSLSKVITWSSPGPELFCVWIAPGEGSITTPITQVITFRSPSGTIAATINPPVPRPGEKATLTVLGTSEAPERAFVKVRPAGGAACAPSFSGDTGGALLDEFGSEVNGAYQLQNTFSESSAGNYVLCLWLASSASSVPAVAGPQPIPFTVASPPPPPPPPPPCIVPSVNSRTRLSTVERRIRAAHCLVGRIHYARARKVSRGNVIGVSPRPHTHLGYLTKVSVVVSLGRRRH